MLQIRGEQVEAFDRAAREEFERELLAHVKDFVPKHAKALGDEGCLKVIRLGIERAATHGFTYRGPVRFYVELMIKFGSGFDTDPQLPWAVAALADKSGDQMARAERLYEKYLDYDAAVVGPESEYARAAIRRSSRLKPADVVVGPEGRAAWLVARLKEYYPEKAADLGDAGLAALVPRGEQLATKYGITSDFGAVVFTVLMFALGHQFDTDPRFPWIEGTLTADRADDPDRRAERLATKALAFAARALANLGGG